MTAQFPPVGYGPPPPNYGGYARTRVPRRGNPVGIVFATVGGALALLGTFLPWYSFDGRNLKLADLVQLLDEPGAKAFPKAYFGYLMWILLAVTIVLGLFGNAATPVALGCRITAPIVGAVGAVGVLIGLGVLIDMGSIFDHSAVGLYLVLGGFLVAGFAGILGPLKVR